MARLGLAVAIALQGAVPGIGPAIANPLEPTVKAGSVAIHESGPRLDIHQSTGKAIIDWRGFSIGSGETTRFHQPSSAAIALNRVTGSDPSAILGALQANGQIMLVNPNGVFFGAGARVDVAGLVATTSDIRDEDFLNGNYSFSMPSTNPNATVVNEGLITIAAAGYAALVAPAVRNSGVVNARLGRVTLGAGQVFALDLYGDSLVTFQVGVDAGPTEDDGRPIEALVRNDGAIFADAGTVTLTADSLGAVTRNVVNMDGLIQANSFENRGGRVVLGVAGQGRTRLAGSIEAAAGSVEIAGRDILVEGGATVSAAQGRVLLAAGNNVTLRDAAIGAAHVAIAADTDRSGGQGTGATGGDALLENTAITAVNLADARGGRVAVTGDRVALLGSTEIAASAPHGGGEIRIGGDYQGRGETRTARATVVGSQARIHADAETAGDGGRVIVWSDEATKFHGRITATGGAQSGDGGFAEVSGKQYLDYQGFADLTAASGGVGMLLLDPQNIDIQDGGADARIAGNPDFTTTGDSAILLTSTIEAALLGSDVTITTSAAGGENGRIVVSGDIDAPNTAFSLTMTAHQNILVNNPINMAANGGTGALTLIADSDGNESGNINLSSATGRLTTNGAAINLEGANFFSTAGSSVTSNGGSITIRNSAPARQINIDTDPNANSFEISDATLDSLDAGTGSITIGGTDQTGNIVMATAMDFGGTADTLILRTGGIAEISRSFNAGSSNLSILAGDVALSAAVTATNRTVTIAPPDAETVVLGSNPGTANSVELTDGELNRITATTLVIGAAAGGAIDLTADISPATVTNLHLISGSTITGLDAAGGITVANLALTAGDAITFTDTTTNVANLAVSAAGQVVTFLDADAIDIDTVDGVAGVTAGSLILTAGGAITDSQAIVATNLSVTNIAASTTLDAAANDVDTLAVSAAGQVVTFVDADDIDIGTVNGILGVTAGSFNLTAGGAITDSQATVATSLSVTNIAASTTLDATANDVGTLAAAATGQTFTFADTTGLTIGSAGGITGLASAALTLRADDGIAIDESIAASSTVAIDADLNNDGTGTFTIAATGAIDAGNNPVTITAARMNLGGALSSGAARTTLLNSVSGAFDLGSATDAAASTVELSDTELDNVTAGILQINNGGAGDITITGALTPANATTLTLLTAGDVTDTGAGSIVVPNLRAEGNVVTLNAATSDVDVLAMQNSSNDVGNSFTDIDDLTIGTVDGLAGVTIRSVTLRASGDFTIDDNISATRDITLINNGVDATTFVNAAIRVSNASTRTITVITDDLEINTATGSFGTNTESGFHSLIIAPLTAGQQIDLGAANTAGNGVMELTNAELGRLNLGNQTLDAIDIGDAASTGRITLSGSIANFSGGGRRLLNNADVVQTAATTIGQLAIDAATGITLDNLANDVTGQLAASSNAGNITIVDANSLTLGTVTANTGNITLTALDGNLTANAVTGGGTVALTAGGDNSTLWLNGAISGTAGAHSYTGDEIAIAGTITATGQTVTLQSDTAGDALHLGAGADDADTLDISGAELQNITAQNLVLGGPDQGDITVDGVTAANSNTIAGTVTLNALRDEATVTFSGTASTFNALSANADAGIDVDTDVTTDIGSLSFDGDADDTDDAGDDSLTFGAGTITVATAGALDLLATTGGIAALGNVVFNINDGFTLGGNLTVAGATTFNADADNDGTGTFTVNDGITLSSAGSPLAVIAADLDLGTTGMLDAGAGTATLRSSNGRAIGLGDTAADFHISRSEVSRITAGALVIGDTTNGSITVDGIQSTDVDQIAGAVTLNATAAGSAVSFANGASVFGALVVNAEAGVIIARNLTAGVLTIDADSDDAGDDGDLVVSTGVTLATTDAAIVVTANDIDLQGTGAIDSGTASTTLLVSDGGSIGLGATAGAYTLSGAELQNITATGLTIGDATTDAIAVDGITAANSSGIAGTLTLNATANGGDVSFANTASTFNALIVNADDSITVTADITSDSGSLALQADTDGAADGDGDRISLASGVALTAAGALTLTAPTGGTLALGPVTLAAANGMTLGDLTAVAATSLNADSDADGTGTFTQAGGTTFSTSDNLLTIIAGDIDLQGSLNSGTAATVLQATNGNSLGLADGAGAFQVSRTELTRLSAASLTLGGANTGTVTVDNLQEADLAGIAGGLTLTAGTATGAATFSGAASAISRALTVRADNGIAIDTDLTTGGTTILDADADDSGAGTFAVATGQTVDSGNGSLTVTAAEIDLPGNLDSGAGTTTLLSSTAGPIDLGTDDGTAGELELTNADLQSITAAALVIGDGTAGAITVSADVTPGAAGGTGVTSLHLVTGSTVTAAAAGIIESSLAITAGGTVSITAASTDVDILAVSAAGQSLVFTDADSLDIGTTAGVAGVTAATFTLNSGGAVTDSTATTVTGTTTLAAGAGNDITLDAAGNDFAILAVTSGRNVTLVDANALDLGAATVSGLLNVTAGGTLTDSGALAVSGTTTLAAGAGNDITLDSAANDFATLAIASGRNVTLVDAGELVLGASTVSGSLNVATGGALTDSGALAVAGTATLAAGAGNDITLDTAGNDFASLAVTSGRNVTLVDTDDLVLGASTVSGALNVTTGGALTDSGALAVTGTATLAAGAANDITLDNAANDFATLAIASGRNVTLVDANALELGASTVSGTLDIATGGALTDSGALAVSGTTTLAAGAGNDIVLDTAANDFATLAVTSGRNVTLVDADDLVLGASTVSGMLNVTASGALTDSGALAVAGPTTLAAGAGNDITLDNAGNDFATVLVTSGRNVTLVDANALDLGASTVSGTLDIAAGGALTDSGALAVTGTAILAAGATNDITLDTAANDFAALAVASGRNVTLVDANALDLGASTVSGTLDIATGGALTDSGALAVAGTATLTAGAVNDITLDNAGNDFAAVAVTSGRNVSLMDTGDLVLGASTVSGALNVTTGGALTGSGALAVTGTATLAAGAANDITLDNAGNDFATVLVTSGRNVTLADANALDLGTSTVSGTLDIATGGALTDSGALAVAGTAALAAGAANDITLDNAGNDFATVLVTSGRNVTLVDANALALGASAISGSLDVAAVSGVTLSGAVTTGGATTIDSDSDGNGSGDFALDAALDTAGNTLRITANDIALASTIDSGAASVTLLVSDGGTIGLGATAGDMTLSGTELQGITAAGLTLGGATNGTVTVDGITAANSDGISGMLTLTSGASIVFDGDASTFNALTANADDGIALAVGLTTVAGAFALDGDADNAADTDDRIAFAAGITLTSAGALTLDGTSGGLAAAGPLTIAANGDALLGADLVALGDLAITADLDADGSGNVTAPGIDAGVNAVAIDGVAVDIGSSLIAGTATIDGAASGSGVAVIALTLTGPSADLSGTVNGVTGPEAAALVDMPDAPAMKFNGCPKSGCTAPAPSGPPAEAPVIENPVIENPVVEDPVVEDPIVDEPVVDNPVVEEPAVEEPVVGEPVVEEPVVATPVVEDPVVAEPVVDSPVVETPIVDIPAAETPAVDTPSLGSPVSTTQVLGDPATGNLDFVFHIPSSETDKARVLRIPAAVATYLDEDDTALPLTEAEAAASLEETGAAAQQ